MNLKISIKILLVIFFIKLNLITVSLGSNNYIVAKVGNEIITSLDVENEIITILVTNKSEINQDSINKTKSIAMKGLVRTLIKKNEIKRYKIDKYNKKDLSDYIDKVAKNLGTNKSGLKEIFKKNGISYKKYITKYETEFLWNTLIFQVYKNQIIINAVEVENELNQRISNPKKLIEYDLSEIEIENTLENKKKIKEIYETIINQGFVNAVKKFSISSSLSNNGKVGVISSNSLSEIYLNKLKDLNVGDVTKPIVTSESIFIIKINNLITKKEENLDPEKVKNLIISKTKEDKLKLFSRSHYSNLENTTLVNFL